MGGSSTDASFSVHSTGHVSSGAGVLTCEAGACVLVGVAGTVGTVPIAVGASQRGLATPSSPELVGGEHVSLARGPSTTGGREELRDEVVTKAALELLLRTRALEVVRGARAQQHLVRRRGARHGACCWDSRVLLGGEFLSARERAGESLLRYARHARGLPRPSGVVRQGVVLDA